jgi:DNA polymerase elongation subunit (family B)
MKILLLDIETAPNVAYVWRTFKENIAPKQIIESGYVICWAAKWLGEDDIYFESVHHRSPRSMLVKIHKLLEKADAVVHYNGTRFDIPHLNKEFLLHGLKPPASYKQIDLLRTARNRFRFPSNKLDYIATALGVGKKHENAGFQLWIDCMAGKEEAWKEMETYNKQDVVLLEAVYNIFLPWIKNHPNVATHEGHEAFVCPSCGGGDLQKRGFTITAHRQYQRYQCKACGSWSRDRNSTGLITPLLAENV